MNFTNLKVINRVNDQTVDLEGTDEEGNVWQFYGCTVTGREYNYDQDKGIQVTEVVQMFEDPMESVRHD